MGRIKKILENELVGGAQTTDVYPVTSVKAVYDEDNERLDNIINRRGVVNISTNYNSDHIAEVLTLQQAIAKVPSKDRVLGFQGKFQTSEGWKSYIFTGDSISDWSDISKWIELISSAVLAQELGDSTTKAISQNAVTKSLEDSSEKINSKITELDNKLSTQLPAIEEAKNAALDNIRENEQSAITNFNSQRVTPEMLSESTKQLIEASGGGTITNFADDEDLISVNDGTGSNVLKFADRTYNPDNFSRKGYKILRKNTIDGKNVLIQNMINQPNTIYEIRYEYDLNGEIIYIPENSTLSFAGGRLKNGKIVFNNTLIKGKDTIFDIDTLQLSGKVFGKFYTSQFGYYPGLKKDISPLIKVIAENGYILQFDKGTYYISETHIQKSNGFSLLGASKIGYNTTTIISPLNNNESYHYLLKFGGMKDFTQPPNYDDYSVHNFSIDSINFQTWGYVGFNNEYATESNKQACGCLCLEFCVGGYLNIAFGGVGEALFLGSTWEVNFKQIKVYGSWIDHNRSAIYFGRSFGGTVASNISAIAIDYILAEGLGGSLLATSSNCLAADIFIGTIAYERANMKTVYKGYSKETIDYILEKKDDLKKVPLLDLRDIGITIGKISDSVGEKASCTVFKENDEEFICNNLKVSNSHVTIGNFNIIAHMDFWELESGNLEAKVLVGNFCFIKSGYIGTTTDTVERLHIIQKTKECGIVQIGNSSCRIIYGYDDVLDISNKCIDSTNIRNFIPDIAYDNRSILYKLHGTTLNGIEKDIIGIHINFKLKLRANPKQILILYVMATWTHPFDIIISYYKNGEIVHTQTKNVWITEKIISYYYIPLSNIDYDYFIIKNFTNTESRFIYAIKCVEQNVVTGSTSSRPTDAFMGLEYYDTTLNKKILWNGTTWVNIDGSSLSIKKEGTTANRPTNIDIGFIYKDTTLNKLILWEGSKWVNLDGTSLS